jgi:DNA-binding LacI/PurR family transcriptional regulator
MTTIDNIARLAGVSPATVSKVLNNRPYVSAEKRARIERVIAETGYVPSQRARGLSTRRSFILGLLIPYTSDQLFADPHLLECVRGIEHETNLRDYNLLLSTARESVESASACVRLLRSDVIDGAIVLETSDLQPFTTALRRPDSPVVIIGYPEDRSLPNVHADDFGGAFAATQHLLQLGHTNIGVISSLLRPFAIDERLRGIREALLEYGLTLNEALILPGDFSVESGEAAATQLLDRNDAPTAIFALNDRMALGAIRAAHARDLRVPEQVSVIGFDDIYIASLLNPPLTTVRQPGYAMGQVAASLLFDLLEERTVPSTTVIATELILRSSSAVPFSSIRQAHLAERRNLATHQSMSLT